MNHLTFHKWFKESLLENLEAPTCIVMDNARYHSKILDKAPTISSRKLDMQEWLKNHNIGFDDTFKKAELLQLINLNKPQYPKYVIDELAREKGHVIIRLPPYHCHFNPIELVWAQVKGHVARENKKFNLTEITRLTDEGLELVTADEWKKVVAHTKKVIEEAWNQEGLMEDAVERLIITNAGGDSSSDDDYDSTLEDDDGREINSREEDEDRNPDTNDKEWENNEHSDSDSDLSGVMQFTPTPHKSGSVPDV